MPISSSNTLQTNKLTDLVALRAVENAGWLTVGAKAYFSGQLADKRNGQTYGFVIRDTGIAVNSLSIGAGEKTALTEKIVNLSLEPWHTVCKTNAVEAVTDMNWDMEVADPQGQKLANGVVRASIAKQLSKVTTAFVGSGFAPLAMAGAHLSSVTSESLFGFVDPMIEAVLTSNGQQFQPAGVPPMYAKGVLGNFHGVEYRGQRFLPGLDISTDMVTAFTGATTAASTPLVVGVDGTTIALAITAAPEAFVIPAGFVFWIKGTYACDLVGDSTSAPYAFITNASANVAKGATTVTLSVEPFTLTAGGTMELAKSDGSAYTVATFPASAAVTIPAAGAYYRGYVRSNGAFEFETLDKLDVSNADTKVGSVAGVTVHQNRIIDLDNMVNDTRWDIVEIDGVVEKRANTLVLIK